MEFVDNLLSGIYVIIGTACAVALIAIFVWAKAVVGDIETRGSSIALSEKLLSAPCINQPDTKGIVEKFIFNKTALDTYNDSVVCAGTPDAITLPGSLYYIEIETDIGTWYFHNNDNIDYAYNTLARGITKTCGPESITGIFPTASWFKQKTPSPYDFNGGNVLRFSGVVSYADMQYLASIKVIVDADSGTGFYPGGYPLCLCDIPCPYTDGCICSNRCDKPLEKIGKDEYCT